MVAILPCGRWVNSYHAAPRAMHVNKINIMATGALAPGVVRPSAAIALTIVFHDPCHHSVEKGYEIKYIFMFAENFRT